MRLSDPDPRIDEEYLFEEDIEPVSTGHNCSFPNRLMLFMICFYSFTLDFAGEGFTRHRVHRLRTPTTNH